MGVGTGVAPFDTPVIVVSEAAEGGGGEAGVAGTGVAGADFRMQSTRQYGRTQRKYTHIMNDGSLIWI